MGWGYNGGGRLGLGEVSNVYSPVQIGVDSDWADVSCGLSNVLAVKKDGTLWTWGDPTIQFGRGPAPFSLTPVQVNFEHTWVQVRAGAWHVVAKKSDGTFWTWGSNAHGQLGDGTIEPKYLPIALGNEQTWREIIPGTMTTMGIKRDGTLWAWGSNSMGHFGTNGEPLVADEPIQLGNDNTWVQVSVGQFHALGIKEDGSLWAWGWNSMGSVGNGFAAPETVPITRIGIDTDWKAVAAGLAHSVALKEDGTAYAWGDNRFGQVGSGSEAYQTIPLEIPSDRSWLSVASGQGSTSSGGIRE